MKTRMILISVLTILALLFSAGTAFATTSTAPGQRWTVGTRVYNPQGNLNFQTSHASSDTGVIAEFNVPSATYGFTDYLYNTSVNSLASGDSITATITIVASSPVFESGPWGSSSPSSTVVAHLFFQSNTPVSDMASCMPAGYGADNYWWSTASYTITGSDSTTIKATLVPGSWTGICGQTATSAQFAQALSSVTEVGLAFGSGSDYAAGMAVTSGSATFQVNSYIIA